MENNKKQPLLILEDKLIFNMSKNITFLQHFPFLNQLQNVKPPSGNCGCKNNNNESFSNVINNIKINIMNLDENNKNLLKNLLNCENIRLFYRDHNGKITIGTI